MLFPKKTKYKKQFKGKLVGQTVKGTKIVYGKYAIKVLEETRLTSRQIEATRRIIIRKMKRLGFLWIRVFPDIPVTSKPTENRMGKGKGALSHYEVKVKPGMIFFEFSGLELQRVTSILTHVQKKSPYKLTLVY